MSELSLMELDAQFSELLPEREALGCFGRVHIPCHDYDPCQPHHQPCDPKPVPCRPLPPCQPVLHHPCGDHVNGVDHHDNHHHRHCD